MSSSGVEVFRLYPLVQVLSMAMPLTDENKQLLLVLEEALQLVGATDATVVLKVRPWQVTKLSSGTPDLDCLIEPSTATPLHY